MKIPIVWTGPDVRWDGVVQYIDKAREEGLLSNDEAEQVRDQTLSVVFVRLKVTSAAGRCILAFLLHVAFFFKQDLVQPANHALAAVGSLLLLWLTFGSFLVLQLKKLAQERDVFLEILNDAILGSQLDFANTAKEILRQLEAESIK